MIILNSKNWHLDEIINTHHHHDHIGGNNKLLDVYKSKLIAPSYDRNHISNVDIFVSDNETLNIAGVSTKVIYSRPYIRACMFLYAWECLFSGDTLFYLGCGRVFEGTMDQMWSSLVKLKSLPDDTNVYCGHEYTLSNMKFANDIDQNNQFLNTISFEIKRKRDKGLPTIPFNLGSEKKVNPFLRADEEDFTNSLGLKTVDAAEIFGEIRLKKDNF